MPGLRFEPTPAVRSILAALVCLLAIVPIGCGGLSVREPWLRNAIEDRKDRFKATNQLSSATGAVLVRFDLLDAAASDPAVAAVSLQTKVETEPVHDGALALAELSYQAGLSVRSRSSKSPSAWYRDAAVLATLALEEPGGSRPDLAVRIHNGAVSRLIRASQAEGRRPGRNWRTVLDEQGIALTATGASPESATNRQSARGRRSSRSRGWATSIRERASEFRWSPTALCPPTHTRPTCRTCRMNSCRTICEPGRPLS